MSKPVRIAEIGHEVPVFSSIEELARAGVCDVTVIVTPTDAHREHAAVLAFQRRFDAPLQCAKELMDADTIGRVVKIYWALEDSNPAPNGYVSGGILPDMSVHDVDEILWLTAEMPEAALAIGWRINSHRLTTCEEDFDDALLYMWFPGGRAEPLAYQRFAMRDYGRPLPEFVDRFGAAYKAELATFIECCRTEGPFPTSHHDGLRAQEVISAGMNAVMGRSQAARIASV